MRISGDVQFGLAGSVLFSAIRGFKTVDHRGYLALEAAKQLAKEAQPKKNLYQICEICGFENRAGVFVVDAGETPTLLSPRIFV